LAKEEIGNPDPVEMRGYDGSKKPFSQNGREIYPGQLEIKTTTAREMLLSRGRAEPDK